MLNIAVFVSGRGSNLTAIYNAIVGKHLEASINLVVSSRSDAGALDFARLYSLPYYIEPSLPDQDGNYTTQLLKTLEQHGVDFIALCGYMRLLSPIIVRTYKNRIVNIHPALLPCFGGKGMYGKHVHETVLESGVKFSGASVHLVDEEYDRGPIVLQEIVPIADTDTPDSLAAKVLTIEHAILPRALQLFSENRIEIRNHKTIIVPPEHNRT